MSVDLTNYGSSNMTRRPFDFDQVDRASQRRLNRKKIGVVAFVLILCGVLIYTRTETMTFGEATGTPPKVEPKAAVEQASGERAASGVGGWEMGIEKRKEVGSVSGGDKTRNVGQSGIMAVPDVTSPQMYFRFDNIYSANTVKDCNNRFEIQWPQGGVVLSPTSGGTATLDGSGSGVLVGYDSSTTFSSMRFAVVVQVSFTLATYDKAQAIAVKNVASREFGLWVTPSTGVFHVGRSGAVCQGNVGAIAANTRVTFGVASYGLLSLSQSAVDIFFNGRFAHRCHFPTGPISPAQPLFIGAYRTTETAHRLYGTLYRFAIFQSVPNMIDVTENNVAGTVLDHFC